MFQTNSLSLVIFRMVHMSQIEEDRDIFAYTDANFFAEKIIPHRFLHRSISRKWFFYGGRAIGRPTELLNIAQYNT